MPASGYSLRASLLQSLTRTKRPDVPPWVVLRNTAAVVLPLGLGLATGHVGIGVGVAAGALDTMFSDQPGPYRQRISRLLLAALAASAAALVGFLVGGDLAPLLIATLSFGFFGGLLVVFGADIARVGMTSMILLVVTAAQPASLAGAFAGAALIFCGGLLLGVLSVAAWPLQRYRPERLELAAVYHGLAALTRRHVDEQTDAPALSEAMNTLQQTLLGRHHARGRAMEAFIVLLELAERIRLELTAMAELRSGPDRHAKYREDAARVLDGIGDALAAGDPPLQAERALRALQASEDALYDGSGDGLPVHVRALSGQLAAAVRNAHWAGSRGELRAAAAEQPLPAPLRSSSALATLQANLDPQSVAFRHAVRSAVALSVAVVAARTLHLAHGYWLPMTVAIVLRPDFAATFNFGLLRVVGTVLGLLLTTALLHITPDEPWAHIVLLALLCMAFRYLATVHYGIAVAALTGAVVILLSFEGIDSNAALTSRVTDTALGSGLALLAYVAWPTWERTRARTALADMLDAYADYLRSLAHPEQHELHREHRTAVRLARTNAQASLDRLRGEPGTPPHLLELANALFANGNRLARTAMTLEALIDAHGDLPEQVEVGHFVEQAADVIQQLADGLHRPFVDTVPQDLRGMQRQLASLLAMADERGAAAPLVTITDRLVDNVDTLAYVAGRGRQTSSEAPGQYRPAHR